MLSAYRELAGRFGDAIVEQDYEAAWALFAPWLREAVSAYDLEDLVQAKIDEVAEIIGVSRSAHPGAYVTAEGEESLEDLRAARPLEPPRRIPAEVTLGNFRNWLRVRFTPGGAPGVEIDAWFDAWLLVVEAEDELRVGYLEVADAE